MKNLQSLIKLLILIIFLAKLIYKKILFDKKNLFLYQLHSIEDNFIK